MYLLLGLAAWAQTPIEIYANGHKYDSLQAYKASEQPVTGHLSKVKPPEITADFLSAATMHELYGLGVEDGVFGALKDFCQASVSQTIAADQIEDAIRKAVTASEAPKLLISESGKVRIMTLNTDEAQK